MKKVIVLVYSAIHFIVDMSCAVLVSNLLAQRASGGYSLFEAIILYDFMAFVLQFPIGILADKLNKNALVSMTGCVLVAGAYAFADWGVAACVVAGVGNALFHVGGGIDVLNISQGKASPSGAFVSTGALGLFLGAKSASFGFTRYYAVVLLLLAAAAVLVWLYIKSRNSVHNRPFAVTRLSLQQWFAVACLMITVCIRSYVGMILSFEWKSSLPLAVAAILAVVLGKMLGGAVGDRIGFLPASVLSLGVAAVLFLFAFRIPAVGIAAILLFNMTMPLTLTALAEIFDGAKGMAFGLLTVALFVGAVPKFFGYTALFTPWGLFGITAASAVILAAGLLCWQRSRRMYYAV